MPGRAVVAAADLYRRASVILECVRRFVPNGIGDWVETRQPVDLTHPRFARMAQMKSLASVEDRQCCVLTGGWRRRVVRLGRLVGQEEPYICSLNFAKMWTWRNIFLPDERLPGNDRSGRTHPGRTRTRGWSWRGWSRRIVVPLVGIAGGFDAVWQELRVCR